MSIMVRPGLMKPRTCCRTCLWASAACLKSFHISSLARSSARLSSLVIRHTALRLEDQHIQCFTELPVQTVKTARTKQQNNSDKTAAICTPAEEFVCATSLITTQVQMCFPSYPSCKRGYSHSCPTGNIPLV